jgi:hypothetical protein
MAQRILAVLAAIFLVSAVGLATLGPTDMPLGQMLFLLHRGATGTLQGFVQQQLSPWAWDRLFVPMMVRPAWLIPAALGIICAGLAVTAAPRRGAPRPRRRN